MKTFALTALALTAVLVVLGASALGSTGETVITVALSGKQEVPKGSPTGTGTAKVRLEPAKGEVCFRLAWSGIGTPVASHIHKGRRGVAGPVVVPLFGGAPKHTGCVHASKTLIRQIIKSPRSYYVNIHTAKYPAGALRGQL